MVQADGSKYSPLPESNKTGRAQTPPEQPFHNEINSLPPDKSMELFRQATGGVLNAGGQPESKAAQEKPADETRLAEVKEQQDQNDDPHPDPYSRIKEALEGPDTLLENAKPKDVARAKEILKKAGVEDPNNKLINAVMIAEELLDRPGLGRKVGIIDQETGKFVDIANLAEAILKKAGIEAPNPQQINRLATAPELLAKPALEKERVITDPKTGTSVDVIHLWEKEIRGHMRSGGPTSDAYAVALYQIANKIYENSDGETNRNYPLAAYYCKEGIQVTKQTYSPESLKHSSMLADQYAHTALCVRQIGEEGKSLKEFWNDFAYYTLESQKIYEEIYRGYTDPEKIGFNLFKKIQDAYLDCSLMLKNDYLSAKNHKRVSEVAGDTDAVLARKLLPPRQ